MTEKNSEQPSNAYEADKPGTAARSLAEVRIEELRTTGGLFVEAVRATRMPMAVTDPSLPGNPIVFANAAFLDLSGYGMDEVLGQQPFFMNGEETDEEDAVRFRKALEEDRDEVIETVQYRKDGSRFVASLFLSAFKDEEGRTVNQFLSYLDVTRRVAAEHELVSRAKIEARLRESEARHRLLVESFAQAVWEADADGVVVADSPSWRSYTGQSLDEWLGYGWLDAIHPDDRAYAERQWRYAVAAGALVNVEFRVRAPDGGWRWTNVRAAPVLDAQGRIEKWAGMNINIDARRRAETDEQQVEQVALKMLADQLLVDRAYITTSDYGKGETEVPVEVRRGELPPLVGIFRHADFPESAQQVNEGTLVVEDVETDTSLSELNRRSFAAVQIKALIGVGLRRRHLLDAGRGDHRTAQLVVERSSSDERGRRAHLGRARARPARRRRCARAKCCAASPCPVAAWELGTGTSMPACAGATRNSWHCGVFRPPMCRARSPTTPTA